MARAIEKDETQGRLGIFDMLKRRGHPDGWPGIDEALIAQRDQTGRVAGTKLKVIFGSREDVVALLGGSTAYSERSHLTRRFFNTRQTRTTLGFSKDVDCCRAAATLEDCYDNLLKPHKSLCLRVGDVPGRKWQPRTPAMAANLSDHIWIAKELLAVIPTKC